MNNLLMNQSLKSRIVAGTILVGGIAVATSSYTASTQQRKTTDPPGMSKGKLCNDLFLAIDHRSNAGVKALIEKGADVDSRNGLGFTPLYIASASYQMDVMKTLIDAGAKTDADSSYGTPLMFAAMSGNAAGAGILMGHGAKVNAVRNDGKSVLMMASISGNPALVDALLKGKADVNAKDDDGSSSLDFAARTGHLKAGEMLVAAGAELNSVNSEKQTPLMAAALTGNADFVKLLLDKGAKPNLQDPNGRTALNLAASFGDNPEVVTALLAGGADPKIADMKGRTPAQNSATHGYSESAKLLGATGSMHSVNPRQAVDRSLKAVQFSMEKFTENASCISCHQEGLGRIATGTAGDRGYALDAKVQKTHKMRVGEMLTALTPLHQGALKDPEVMKNVPLIEINEVNSGYSWLLAGMAAQHEPATEATAAMTMVLAKQQQPSGCWSFSLPRIPMQSSPFTFTMLALRAMKVYGPKSEAESLGKQVDLAKDWLLKTPAHSSEDRASRLMGLKLAGATAADLESASKEIAADQKPDGGWSQTPELHSDAYATGQALCALHAGGMPVNDPVYAKGVKFLLRTQDDDGSWFVNKRAIAANNYFDAGFPHGQSQYSSFNGTCWATMALLQTLTKR